MNRFTLTFATNRQPLCPRCYRLINEHSAQFFHDVAFCKDCVDSHPYRNHNEVQYGLEPSCDHVAWMLQTTIPPSLMAMQFGVLFFTPPKKPELSLHQMNFNETA